jgi:putative phage-type endonuclease
MMALSLAERQLRRKSIGGSEIAVIAGVSPFQTAMQLYTEKLGLNGDEPIPDTEVQTFGHVFEDPAARVYEMRHQVKVEALTETLIHPKYNFLTANPDRVVMSLERLLEIKTTGIGGLKYWIDPENPDTLRPPQYVLLQVNWYLGFLGWQDADIVLVNFAESYRYERYYEFPVAFDPELFALEVQLAIDFWQNHVLAGVPPEASTPEDDAVRLALTYPQHSTEMLPATPEANEIARELYEAQQQKKQWEQRVTELHNRMKTLIGGKLGMEEPGQWKYTWKQTASGGTDWEALARSLGATEEHIAKFARKGYRRAYFSFREEKAGSV